MDGSRARSVAAPAAPIATALRRTRVLRALPTCQGLVGGCWRLEERQQAQARLARAHWLAGALLLFRK